MPGEAVGIVLAAGSGNWRTQSAQFLQLVVLCSAVKAKTRIVHELWAQPIAVVMTRKLLYIYGSMNTCPELRMPGLRRIRVADRIEMADNIDVK